VGPDWFSGPRAPSLPHPGSQTKALAAKLAVSDREATLLAPRHADAFLTEGPENVLSAGAAAGSENEKATEADGTTWELGNGLPVVASGASPGRDAARALSPAEAPRSALPALPPGRERPPAEGTTLRIDGAPFRDYRPGGAAVDAFFGGVAPLPSG